MYWYTLGLYWGTSSVQIQPHVPQCAPMRLNVPQWGHIKPHWGTWSHIRAHQTTLVHIKWHNMPQCGLMCPDVAKSSQIGTRRGAHWTTWYAQMWLNVHDFVCFMITYLLFYITLNIHILYNDFLLNDMMSCSKYH